MTVKEEVEQLFLGVVHNIYVVNLNQIQTISAYKNGKINLINVASFQVKIMLPWDPQGKIGPKKPLPDHVSIVEPKEETLPPNPFSETKAVKPDQAMA